MVKNDVYYFHQSPQELCEKLIKFVDISKDDVLYEPFAGEGAFLRSFPKENETHHTEIEEGTDFKDFDFEKTHVDWVISNPPFRLESTDGKRVNSFYYLVDFFADKVEKGFAFLGNDACFSTLTPKRLQHLHEEKKIYIDKIVVCNVKRWRGRYFFIIFKKCDGTNKENRLYNWIEGSY